MNLKRIWDKYTQIKNDYHISNVDCAGYDSSGEIQLELQKDGQLILTFNKYDEETRIWVPERTFELKIIKELR